MQIDNNIILLCGNIKTLRTELGLSMVEFSESVGTSQGYLSQIERAHKSPGSEILIKIKDKHLVNMEWLFTGRGPMFINYIGENDVTVNKNARSTAVRTMTIEQQEFIINMFNTDIANDKQASAIFTTIKVFLQNWGLTSGSD